MKITELFNNPKDPIDQILNKDKVIKDTQFEKEKTLRYALFGGLALMILLAGLSYRNYKRKQTKDIRLRSFV